MLQAIAWTISDEVHKIHAPGVDKADSRVKGLGKNCKLNALVIGKGSVGSFRQ